MMVHRKRCHRFNDAGHAHALTFSCFRRQPFLSRDRSAQWMLDAIDRARERHAFHVWAYVIMPEHLHLLIWPTQREYSISAILTTLKQSVSSRALAYVKSNASQFLERMADRRPGGRVVYRFWQRGGGYDRNLFEPAVVWSTIEYIHHNPVRRGLCERAIDWTYSSALEYHRPGCGLLRIDRESLPRTSAG